MLAACATQCECLCEILSAVDTTFCNNFCRFCETELLLSDTCMYYFESVTVEPWFNDLWYNDIPGITINTHLPSRQKL